MTKHIITGLFISVGLLASQTCFANTDYSTTNVNSTVAVPAQWEVAIGMGGSINKSETLTLHQNNNPDITLRDAEIQSKPFNTPRYYGLRVSRWQNDKAWEMEHIHQKLYIDDLPDDVQHFEITDGYNLFYVNRAYDIPKHNIILRAGAGFVVAHPQITIYDETNYRVGGGAIPKIWDTASGYQWAGLSGQVSAEKYMNISENITLGLEAKVTHSQADIDIANGNVKMPNTALHGLAWMKYRF